ncbi:hypothetical protein Tco_0662022 [Tanacetum coccineum]
MSSSMVTYTSISSYSDLPPWGFHLISDAEPQSPEAVSLSPEQASLSPDYVPGPEYPEYLAPSDDDIPVEDQPLPTDASPTTLSPGYVADSDPEEDLEEDPTDYPADGGDDDEEEEASEDDEDEESEHLALANSTALPAIDLVPSTCLCRARKTIRPQPPMAASTEALDTVDASIRATEGRVMTAVEEVNERMTYLATSHGQETENMYTRHMDAQDDRAELRAHISTLEREAIFSLYAMEAHIRALQRDVSMLQRQRINNGDRLTRHIQHEHDRARDAKCQDGPDDAGSSC